MLSLPVAGLAAQRRYSLVIPTAVWCCSPRHRYFCTPRNGARANARLAYSFGKNERFGCRKRFPRGLVEILKIGGVIFGRHDLDWPSD